MFYIWHCRNLYTGNLLMKICKRKPPRFFICKEPMGVQFLPRRLVMTLQPDETNPPAKQFEIERYLKSCQLPLIKGFTCWHCACPSTKYPPPSLRKETSNRPKTVFVNMTTGMFIDYEHELCGPWKAFQNLADLIRGKKVSPADCVPDEASVFLTDDQYEDLENTLNAATKIDDLTLEEYNVMYRKFNLQGLMKETFRMFGVRLSGDRNALLFPYHDPNNKLSGIKTISCALDQDGRKELLEHFTPNQSPLSIFGGGHTIHKGSMEIVIVGSVLDAMTVTQETPFQAIALPRKSFPLPTEILPWFEKFTRVTLWLGLSLQDWEATRTIMRKLGIRRCFFIRPTECTMTALAALQSGHSVLKILSRAEPGAHKFITSYHSLKSSVLQELRHTEQVSGTKWTRFPGLNKLLKGHRRGEVTIFTGPTGSGKTTFLSEYSLDLCMQGVTTLWGSFEIQNVRLAKLMITQFSLVPLEQRIEEFESWSDKFEELPLYFITLHGQQSVDQILEIMAHAVYVHDIQHVVVDNLQFMMGIDTKMDRFWRQDLVISSFRKFATLNNCHVTLVIHPRKENLTDELSNNSISGGAKASQEADNILILQDRRLNMLKSRKYIQVTKNRFDGDIGHFPIEFDKATKSFAMKKKNKVIELSSMDKKTSSDSNV